MSHDSNTIQYPTTLSYAGDLVALDSLLIHRNLQARMPAKDAVEPGWRICIGFVHLPTSSPERLEPLNPRH